MKEFWNKKREILLRLLLGQAHGHPGTGTSLCLTGAFVVHYTVVYSDKTVEFVIGSRQWDAFFTAVEKADYRREEDGPPGWAVVIHQSWCLKPKE